MIPLKLLICVVIVILIIYERIVQKLTLPKQRGRGAEEI